MYFTMYFSLHFSMSDAMKNLWKTIVLNPFLILILDKLNLLPWGNKVWRGEKTDFEGCLRNFKVDGMT